MKGHHKLLRCRFDCSLVCLQKKVLFRCWMFISRLGCLFRRVGTLLIEASDSVFPYLPVSMITIYSFSFYFLARSYIKPYLVTSLYPAISAIVITTFLRWINATCQQIIDLSPPKLLPLSCCSFINNFLHVHWFR